MLKRVFGILLLLGGALPAVACPMCRDAVSATDTASPGGVPAGFNASIYVVLLTFAMVLGGVVLSMVQATRKR